MKWAVRSLFLISIATREVAPCWLLERVQAEGLYSWWERDHFLFFTLLFSLKLKVFSLAKREQQSVCQDASLWPRWATLRWPWEFKCTETSEISSKKNNSKAHKTWRPSCENHKLTGNRCEQTGVSVVMDHVIQSCISFHLWSFSRFLCVLWDFFFFGFWCVLCVSAVLGLMALHKSCIWPLRATVPIGCHTQTMWEHKPTEHSKDGVRELLLWLVFLSLLLLVIVDCIQPTAASHFRVFWHISIISDCFSPEERFVPTLSSVSLISLFFLV